jgi:glycerophosphoryl diester phosphodiesterase
VTSHDPFLKETTNIEEYKDKYADRMGSWDYRPTYGNVYTDDWLIHNFTLAELKELKRVQRYPDLRNTDFDKFFQIMTFEEVIELMFELHEKYPNSDRKYPIGLYVETKMYAFYKQQSGRDIANMTYDVLKKYNLSTIEDCQDKLPIIIECFEGDSLKQFATLSNLPLVRLMN